MKFLNDYDQLSGDTIAAIATAPGDGGVAIVRISGATCKPLVDSLFGAPLSGYESHKARYLRLRDANGGLIDQLLVLPMWAPKSYTGEEGELSISV